MASHLSPAPNHKVYAIRHFFNSLYELNLTPLKKTPENRFLPRVKSECMYRFWKTLQHLPLQAHPLHKALRLTALHSLRVDIPWILNQRRMYKVFERHRLTPLRCSYLVFSKTPARVKRHTKGADALSP